MSESKSTEAKRVYNTGVRTVITSRGPLLPGRHQDLPANEAAKLLTAFDQLKDREKVFGNDEPEIQTLRSEVETLRAKVASIPKSGASSEAVAELQQRIAALEAEKAELEKAILSIDVEKKGAKDKLASLQHALKKG